MYPPPHHKILGRTLSDKPNVGIPLALEIINDPKTHRDDYLSAACYLGYRLLDGTYKDVDFLWPKIQEGYNFAHTIVPPAEPDWFRSRWISSYNMLQIYIKILILNEKIPIDLLTAQTTSKHEQYHPPQLPNVMRGWAMLILYRYANYDVILGKELTLEAVEKYKKSIVLNKLDTDISIAEVSEATACLMFITQLKGVALDDIFHREYYVEDLIKLHLENPSYGFYYKCLHKIYKNEC